MVPAIIVSVTPAARIRPRRRLLLLLGSLLIAGCSLWQENVTSHQLHRAQTMEPMLQDAGFARHEIDTPERQQQLQSLPPVRLMSYTGRHSGQKRWAFADPVLCHCLYIGTQYNYDNYQQIKKDRYRQEAEASNEEINQAYMDAEMTGPDYYGAESILDP